MNKEFDNEITSNQITKDDSEIDEVNEDKLNNNFSLNSSVGNKPKNIMALMGFRYRALFPIPLVIVFLIIAKANLFLLL
jgi:hypothetical protein